MKKSEKIFKLIVCLSIIIATFILRIFDQNDDSKTQSIINDLNNEIISDSPGTSNNNTSDSSNNTSSSENNFENNRNHIIKENIENSSSHYDESASDGNMQYAYFENGDVLYNNSDIPLQVYANQMDSIQDFVDLNYSEAVTKLTILEDSVKIENGFLTYTCDMYNDHLLYVTCDLSTYTFSFSDSLY